MNITCNWYLMELIYLILIFLRRTQALVIGVRKCGTRALLEMLYLHPRIQKAAGEVHFFDRDENYWKGLEWYRKKMPHSFRGQITIEKSPSYFVTPEVSAKILKFKYFDIPFESVCRARQRMCSIYSKHSLNLHICRNIYDCFNCMSFRTRKNHNCIALVIVRQTILILTRNYSNKNEQKNTTIMILTLTNVSTKSGAQHLLLCHYCFYRTHAAAVVVLLWLWPLPLHLNLSTFFMFHFDLNQLFTTDSFCRALVHM